MFRDLHEHMEKQNLREHLWLSAFVGQGSVFGNAIERSVGATPYGDHWGMYCGMEVVLQNGKLVLTSMGSVPNPNADPNSNLDVVTKIGIWLMHNPGGYQPREIIFEHDSDLSAVVDIIRPLRLQIVPLPQVSECCILRAKSKWTANKGQLPEEEVNAIAKKLDMGHWQLVSAVCRVYELSGEDANKQHDVAKNPITSHGFVYLRAFSAGIQELHQVETTARRWGQFRAHTAPIDPVADAFRWNNNTQNLNGIPAPGKNGV
ncbi:vanillyl-alcohol oxidase [Colletotrichum graminicola]|nr:vanillyl-alcohol oxidase [Colletotrichum graminicola]